METSLEIYCVIVYIFVVVCDLMSTKPFVLLGFIFNLKPQIIRAPFSVKLQM